MTDVIEVMIETSPRVIEVVIEADVQVIEVLTPGIQGPIGPPGDGSEIDLPDLTLIFENQLL